MSLVVRILDRLFPREELPFGTRWRIFGRREKRADYSRCLLAPRELLGRAYYLHRMVRGDQHRDWHDHRYRWTSIILKGGYAESLLDPSGVPRLEFRKSWSIKSRAAIEPHVILRLLSPVCWTLFVTGRAEREWGFWRLRDGGIYWTPADEYRKELGL